MKVVALLVNMVELFMALGRGSTTGFGAPGIGFGKIRQLAQ